MNHGEGWSDEWQSYPQRYVLGLAQSPGPAIVALLRFVDSLPSSSAWPGHLDCRCGNCPEPARKRPSAVAGTPKPRNGQDGTPKTGTGQISAETRETA
jgi:hypothetical protein